MTKARAPRRLSCWRLLRAFLVASQRPVLSYSRWWWRRILECRHRTGGAASAWQRAPRGKQLAAWLSDCSLASHRRAARRTATGASRRPRSSKRSRPRFVPGNIRPYLLLFTRGRHPDATLCSTTCTSCSASCSSVSPTAAAGWMGCRFACSLMRPSWPRTLRQCVPLSPPRCVPCRRGTLDSRTAQVARACDAIENEHMRHLLLLRASPRYVERQEAVLRQMLDHASKMHRCAEISCHIV